ncbi:MAG: site-specific DNA-methyltransferase, partial [Myxococcota bacterium]
MPRASKKTRRDAGVNLVWPGKETAETWPPLDRSALETVESYGEGPGDVVVQGDNLVALSALSADYEGRVDLVYIDPPFATGLSFYQAVGGRREDGSRIVRRAYHDGRKQGLADYLTTMRPRLTLLHRWLNDDGHLFLHCDWRANAWLRLVLDEIFGSDCFRNEIIWRRAPNLGRQAAAKQLGRVVDSIFVYSKKPGARFPGGNPRRRAVVELDRTGKPKGTKWDEARQLYFSTAPRGDYTDESIERLRKEGRVYDSASGKVYIKYFLTRGEDGRWYKEQPVDTLWDDYEVRPLRHRPKSEDMGYDTQKPEGLLERIVRWGSPEGGLVVDAFAGSGTTARVAARLGRRYVAIDIGHGAAVTMRRRLLREGRPSVSFFSADRAERSHTGEADVELGSRLLADWGASPTGEVGGHHWGRREDGSWVCAALVDEALRNDDVFGLVARHPGAPVTVLCGRWGGADAAAIAQLCRERFGVELDLRTIPMERFRGEACPPEAYRQVPEVDVDIELFGDAVEVELRGVRVEPPPRAARSRKPGMTPRL